MSLDGRVQLGSALSVSWTEEISEKVTWTFFYANGYLLRRGKWSDFKENQIKNHTTPGTDKWSTPKE
jgi:hypothetical protein